MDLNSTDRIITEDGRLDLDEILFIIRKMTCYCTSNRSIKMGNITINSEHFEWQNIVSDFKILLNDLNSMTIPKTK